MTYSMKTIPRYWGYARTVTGCLLWRSSPNSQDDANEEARKAAERVSRYEKAKRRSERPQSEDYPYGVTLREKLLEEINDSLGRLQGFITRNQKFSTSETFCFSIGIRRKKQTAWIVWLTLPIATMYIIL